MSQRQNFAEKLQLGWLLKMAWRDGRASFKRLTLFMASIILGIAAVVAIQSFGQSLTENIDLQSKSLMGADFIINSKQPPNEAVRLIIDSLGGAAAKSISFPSMAVFQDSKRTKLVNVKGIEGSYPFYGALETAPNTAALEYQDVGGALVDATLMLQFGLNPGDSISIGKITLPITGSLISAPGSTGISTSVAPPVLIPYRFLEATGLIQVGSRIGYNFYFVAPQGQDLKALDKKVDPLLDAENADLDTHTSTGQRLGRRYENFGKFLNLVAFIALLLGCVGIASSVHLYIKEKLVSLAVLKCLGASRKQTFLIYLIQIAGMGFLGGLMGTLIGLAVQQLFPWVLSGFLPFEVVIGFSLEPIILGLLLGFFMSLLFALAPLISTWQVSPLQVLRIEQSRNQKLHIANLLILLSMLGFIFLFSNYLLQNVQYALAFTLGIVLVFSLLGGLALFFFVYEGR